MVTCLDTDTVNYNHFFVTRLPYKIAQFGELLSWINVKNFECFFLQILNYLGLLVKSANVMYDLPSFLCEKVSVCPSDTYI